MGASRPVSAEDGKHAPPPGPVRELVSSPEHSVMDEALRSVLLPFLAHGTRPRRAVLLTIKMGGPPC